MKELQTKLESFRIAMEYGISKFSHITLTARNLVDPGGMELSSGEIIPKLLHSNKRLYLADSLGKLVFQKLMSSFTHQSSDFY